MCEALGIYLPLSSTAVTTIYRTPNYESEDFSQAINGVRKWLTSLESKYKSLPTIIVNGDFNFPTMKSWSSNEILTFLDKIHEREDRANIGTVTLQNKLLCDLVQDLYLHQIIQGHTRKNNLLDLFFCNDLDIITGHSKIENVLFSNHTLRLINTLIAPELQKECRQ